jgi:hypothetical protein
VSEELKIECPCGEDMTEAVLRACRVGKPKDAGYFLLRAHAEEPEGPEAVQLSCPKGHVADYRCPGVMPARP